MIPYRKKQASLIASCIAIFWPGAFIFGFPGVMGPYWQTTFGVGKSAVGQSLFLIVLGAGAFMYLSGRWLNRFRPERLSALGVVLCSGSAILAGLAQSIDLIYLWAFLVGASSAFLLVPALTVVQIWYPKRRGQVSGIVNMVFGVSAAIMSPIFSMMMSGFGYMPTTLSIGLLSLFTGLAAVKFICLPEEMTRSGSGSRLAEETPESLSISQSIKTRAFWLLWLTWAMAGAAGFSMVHLAPAFGLSKGLSLQKAVFILSAFNITNGLGRYVSGHLSDIYGRRVIMSAVFAVAGIAYFLFPGADDLILWCILSGLVGFAFGTQFAVSAPLVVDCFGMENFGAVFGLVFTAYAFVSGPLGPWLSGFVLDVTAGNFQIVFIYLGLCYLGSAILIAFVRPPKPISSPYSKRFD
jgi:MFS transporter, OFA family, oxalate/formate antiporter